MCPENSPSPLLFAPQGQGCFGKMGIPPRYSDLLSLGQTCREGERGSGRRLSHQGVQQALELAFHYPLLLKGLPPLDLAEINPGLPPMALKKETPVICNLFYKGCSQEKWKGRQDYKTYICPGKFLLASQVFLSVTSFSSHLEYATSQCL